jgi:hypothetical protein
MTFGIIETEKIGWAPGALRRTNNTAIAIKSIFRIFMLTNIYVGQHKRSKNKFD